jgi:predicted ester cyclase
MPSQSTITRLNAAIAAWNAGDLDGYLDLYDAGIRLHGYSPEPMDKAAVAGFYRMIHDTLRVEGGQAPRVEIVDVVGDGDRVAFRFAQSGHHVGPFMGFAPTGRPYAIGGITIMRFAGGRVAERWSAVDMFGLLVQIGAVPPPG